MFVMLKWKNLSKEEKKKRLEKTYQSIEDDEESVNLFERFKKINPDVSVSLEEFYEFISE